MKKLTLLLAIFLLSISFSCQEDENPLIREIESENTEFSLTEASKALSEIFTSTIDYTNQNISFDLDFNGNLEIANSDLTTEYLRKNYFPNFPEKFKLNLSYDPKARTAQSEYFTNEQAIFIEAMEILMGEVRSSEELKVTLEELRIELHANEQMTDEQKLEMLALVEVTNSLHENLIAGGLDQIASVVIDSRTSTGRYGGVNSVAELSFNACGGNQDDSQDCGGGGDSSDNTNSRGCSVNWRNVWAGAVASGAIGAGIGLKAGCAGGTIVVPLLGTLAGCTGGLIGGLATGYVTGAAGSILAELITSCGR